MHVYVINLERSTQRRAAMHQQLATLGLPADFVSAVDGKAVDRRNFPDSRHLSDGELGCYLSHIAVWQRLLDSGADAAMVLEDDVQLAADFASLIVTLETTTPVIDMVRVSSVMPVAGVEIVRLNDRYRLLLPTRNPSGTQGYWLNRAGARRLLEHHAIPLVPIDKQLDAAWRGPLHLLLLDPPAVHEHADSVSTIGQRMHFRRPAKPVRKLKKLLRRWLSERRARQLRSAWHAATLLPPAKSSQ